MPSPSHLWLYFILPLHPLSCPHTLPHNVLFQEFLLPHTPFFVHIYVFVYIELLCYPECKLFQYRYFPSVPAVLGRIYRHIGLKYVLSLARRHISQTVRGYSPVSENTIVSVVLSVIM